MRSTRLVPDVRAALLLLAPAVAVFVTLAVLVHGRADNRFDHAVLVRVQGHVPRGLIDAALHLTDPALIVVLVLLLLSWAIVRWHWRAAVLVVAVPLGCVLLTEHVLKPWIDRTDGGYFAFPSGHETGVAGVACVAAVLLLASRARAALKVVGLLALALHVALAALALVGSDYHYATDTLGSLALCASVTLLVALGLDAVGRHRPGDVPAAQAPMSDAPVSDAPASVSRG